MLTLLYHSKTILKSLLSGVPTSLPGGFNSRSLLMGIIGRWADHVDLPVTAVAEAFGVTPQAVYRNINRLQHLEAKIDAQPDLPADCTIITKRDVGKICLSLALDAHASLEGIQRVLTTIRNWLNITSLKVACPKRKGHGAKRPRSDKRNWLITGLDFQP